MSALQQQLDGLAALMSNVVFRLSRIEMSTTDTAPRRTDERPASVMTTAAEGTDRHIKAVLEIVRGEATMDAWGMKGLYADASGRAADIARHCRFATNDVYPNQASGDKPRIETTSGGLSMLVLGPFAATSSIPETVPIFGPYFVFPQLVRHGISFFNAHGILDEAGRQMPVFMRLLSSCRAATIVVYPAPFRAYFETAALVYLIARRMTCLYVICNEAEFAVPDRFAEGAECVYNIPPTSHIRLTVRQRQLDVYRVLHAALSFLKSLRVNETSKTPRVMTGTPHPGTVSFAAVLAEDVRTHMVFERHEGIRADALVAWGRSAFDGITSDVGRGLYLVFVLTSLSNQHITGETSRDTDTGFDGALGEAAAFIGMFAQHLELCRKTTPPSVSVHMQQLHLIVLMLCDICRPYNVYIPPTLYT